MWKNSQVKGTHLFILLPSRLSLSVSELHRIHRQRGSRTEANVPSPPVGNFTLPRRMWKIHIQFSHLTNEYSLSSADCRYLFFLNKKMKVKIHLHFFQLVCPTPVETSGKCVFLLQGKPICMHIYERTAKNDEIMVVCNNSAINFPPVQTIIAPLNAWSVIKRNASQPPCTKSFRSRCFFKIKINVPRTRKKSKNAK